MPAEHSTWKYDSSHLCLQFPLALLHLILSTCCSPRGTLCNQDFILDTYVVNFESSGKTTWANNNSNINLEKITYIVARSRCCIIGWERCKTALKFLQPSGTVVTKINTAGRAIAQAVSRQVPRAAARVRAQVTICGICGGQSDTGAGFILVLRFPLPLLFPPIAAQSSSVIRGWYNRPNSGRRTKWTQSHPKKLKKI
jgi:hypothetical protein